MRYLPVFPLILLTACTAAELPESERMVSPILSGEEAHDEFTFAQPEVARVTHLALDLTLDFEAKELCGSAKLDILAEPNADTVVLDSNGLRIAAVADASGNPLPYEVGEHKDGMGEPITISMGASRKIAIEYCSAPEAEALQWLDPEQTAGGEHPYLFSQGQAILNRSWIPTQDSPGIRQSWEARITAPKPLNVVMSGIIEGEPEDAGEGRRAFRFAMDKPVAPYLIAIAAGNIEFRELGPRSGVWSEPEIIEAAAAELAETEAMIDAAEGLYGEYRWGRYDMIVLPPSFPYGGMENPVMTFLTPTFIAGDRSNTGLVAHELAHSWSGNLVTYASWRDGWLNEGVTSYIESRISEEVFGKTRAEQEYALSFAALEEMIEETGADDPATAMHTPDSISPFDTKGEAIYDKGTVFLRTMETIVGRERFDAWLRNWFDAHAFAPATSAMFIADLRKNLVQGDAKLDESLMLEEWIYGTGLPENAVRPDAEAFAAVDSAVAAYAADRTLPQSETWAGWSAAERRRFLEEMPETLSAAELAALDRTLGLSRTGNNEVLFLWLEAALRNRYDPAVPQTREFLREVGRNKFVEPLFEALAEQGEWGMAIARPLYADLRGRYHSYTRGQVDAILNPG